MGTLSPSGSNHQSQGGEQGQAGERKKAWREAHRSRYGKTAKNPKVHPDVQEAIVRIKGPTFDKICDACNSSHYKMKQCHGIEEGVCPAYAAGMCNYEQCVARHLMANEMPRGWLGTYTSALRKGMKRIRDGEEIPQRRRRRPGTGGRGT